MNELLNYLNTIHPLSDELTDYLSRNLKIKELPKRSFLLKAGHVCRSIYFIQKGLLRCFYEQDETEVSSWFMSEGNVIISVESFFRQKESYESILALEDSVLHYIDYSELQYIYHHYPEFNFIGRVLTENYYMLSEQRLFSMRCMKAPERYAYLVRHFPEIIRRVPYKYIASYLGVTEVTLSNIRNRMSNPTS
jgi:CRP/FNR family transcriptional regulator, anaerobic regulatory protein